MADEIDRGNETADKTLAGYIAAVRARANLTMQPTGTCYNCEEPVAPGRLFCDASCREDYDYRQRRTG